MKLDIVLVAAINDLCHKNNQRFPRDILDFRKLLCDLKIDLEVTIPQLERNLAKLSELVPLCDKAIAEIDKMHK